MKRFIAVVSVLGVIVCLSSCGKKEPALEESQEPVSMEILSSMNSAEIKPTIEPVLTETQTVAANTNVSAPVNLEPLPPSGPYKPSIQQIQTALKNAGFYTGNIDGKSGSLTKKAIEEFQQANNLKVDGKVGPNTWGILSQHLNPAPVSTKPAKKKIR